MDDIGLLQVITAKGFGFATSLTGDRTRNVFLNETRIAHLDISSPQADGLLIQMRTTQQADGRWSATRAWRLDLTAPGTVDLARRHLARQLGSPEAAALPAPLLELLWGFDPAVDRKVGPVALALPDDAWCSPSLLKVMELCPPTAWRRAFPRHILAEPARALRALQREVHRTIDRYCPSTWLKLLWDALPAQRGDVLNTAYAVSSRLTALQAATWARTAIDHNAALGTSADPATVAGWWSVLQKAMESSFTLDTSWQEWSGWGQAPWPLVKIALKRWESKNVLQAIAALEETAAHSGDIGCMTAGQQLSALDERDCLLAELWAPRLDGENSKERIDAVRAQMWTARAAENCAGAYFRKLKLSVEDIASEQLGADGGDWQKMDLRINGRHGIDVKCLRRTIHGGMQSSRWKVKSFKTDAAGTKVTLCGVSSPYTFFSNSKLTCEDGEDMRVLGVTTATEITSLARRFTSIFALRTNPASKLLELPAWAWDYPHAQYHIRNHSMIVLRETLGSLQSTVIGRRTLAALPPVFFSFWDLPAPSLGQFNPQQRDFLERLRTSLFEQRSDRPGGCVPRLPWLYLFILHLWASWRSRNALADTKGLLRLFQWHAHSPSDAAKAAANIRASSLDRSELDADGIPTRFGALARSINTPSAVAGSGVVDPANTLSRLIDSLGVLEKRLPQDKFVALSDITHFYNGILVGTFPDGQRKTLLAHCGGRFQNGAECGNRPLIFGAKETCACGRLVCDRCGTCTDTRFATCERQNERLRLRSAASLNPAPRRSR
ncbi:hypothetical protein HFK18_13210|uniref:hypothetical protein n=1 Tax=Stenotrophomonas sp. SbOxS2 TaxID=2723885 RepID=UPI0015D18EF9|nr:hypothetical protein [Stenotrophomonas sp. SbOxS2]NYT99436.1 hypothetical protein [Stenotrophomonas sp. SbOxS2]